MQVCQQMKSWKWENSRNSHWMFQTTYHFGKIVMITSTLLIRTARPQVDVVPSLSQMTRSGRQMVFQVENFELLKALVTIGTEND